MYIPGKRMRLFGKLHVKYDSSMLSFFFFYISLLFSTAVYNTLSQATIQSIPNHIKYSYTLLGKHLEFRVI